MSTVDNKNFSGLRNAATFKGKIDYSSERIDSILNELPDNPDQRGEVITNKRGKETKASIVKR
jgi:hypothetical protein